MSKVLKEAIDKSAKFCSRKEICEMDLRKKLYIWKIPENLHNIVVSELYSANYLNHSRYVQSFANDKISINKWGINKIRFALRQKQISDIIIENFFKNIDKTKYIENLEQLINKKIEEYKNKNRYETKMKLMRFLQGRGFSFDEISDAFDKIEL